MGFNILHVTQGANLHLVDLTLRRRGGFSMKARGGADGVVLDEIQAGNVIVRVSGGAFDAAANDNGGVTTISAIDITTGVTTMARPALKSCRRMRVAGR